MMFYKGEFLRELSYYFEYNSINIDRGNYDTWYS